MVRPMKPKDAPADIKTKHGREVWARTFNGVYARTANESVAREAADKAGRAAAGIQTRNTGAGKRRTRTQSRGLRVLGEKR